MRVGNLQLCLPNAFSTSVCGLGVTLSQELNSEYVKMVGSAFTICLGFPPCATGYLSKLLLPRCTDSCTLELSMVTPFMQASLIFGLVNQLLIKAAARLIVEIIKYGYVFNFMRSELHRLPVWRDIGFKMLMLMSNYLCWGCASVFLRNLCIS